MAPPRLCSDYPTPPPVPDFKPGEKYHARNRMWQGIPSIERAINGRLWATWYSGGKQEDNDNYVLLVTSDDDGRTWSDPVAVVDPPGLTRAWDPCLWHDPRGRLWWTWTQTTPMPGEAWDGRGGVWVMTTENSGDPAPRWSEPRRIGHGVALNKPVFSAGGEWLLPVTIWWMFEQFAELNATRAPGLLCSSDEGATWERRGSAVFDDRVFDEPMVVERRDGTLWMLVRTRSGIAESFSADRGVTWSRGRPSALGGPSSRFHVRRLASGRLLLVNHFGNPDRKRSHLTALLSEDDGVTWPHRLLLDDRAPVSYPDAIEGPGGRLYVIYDFDRYGAREVCMAVVSEEDILAGRLASPQSRLKGLVSKGGARLSSDRSAST